MLNEETIRKVHGLIRSIYDEKKSMEKFIPLKTKVHYSGPIFDEKEVNSVIDSLIDGWLAEGNKTAQFEKNFKDYIGAKDCVVTNTGSSALLLSFAALMNPKIKNHLEKGDEVITSALTFPTTLNSVILNNLEPVFVDVEEGTYNMNPDIIEDMITEKTRALLVVHHLGNPCNMDMIMKIAKKHNLFVVEDCCDAHGAEYMGKKVGSFGDMGCFSFYGAHAMTMGEGGAITLNSTDFRPILMSLKTCGRACACPVCKMSLNSNYICPFRWESDIQGFEGYDKRTLYPYIGYKLKTLNLQAAFGIEQLKKLPYFIRRRTENYEHITGALRKYDKYLMLPKIIKNAKPSWFSIPITIKEGAPFTRTDLVDHLEKHNIETRPLLGGNILMQPAYRNMKFRSTELRNTNFFHVNSFYIGCHPGITEGMRQFMLSVFTKFFENL